MGLKILIVSAEVAPFAKVGGLADVAGSLPKALKKLGHDVRVLMPSYAMIENDPRWQLTLEKSFAIKLGQGWKKQAYIKSTELAGVKFYFAGTNQWFTESISSPTVYLPGSDQYLFLAKVTLEALKQLKWIPDVIHCNDWHTGFIPVMMEEADQSTWAETASVFTIHNLAYQGEFDEEILRKLELPMALFNFKQLETYGRVNFLKSACVYSDQVNTVSPTYALEIQTPEYGCRLEGLMRYLDENDQLRGILNGLDEDEFNPMTDPDIAAPFDPSNLGGKAACKKALLEELNLKPLEGAPLFGVVSRLSSQKGMDLFIECAPQFFKLNAQLVVQGLGDPWLADRFRELQDLYPDKFRFVEKFDQPFAQRVYAGSDIFLMPSSFEPCGLGQMIAMRYGTIPLVRKTGGLADTVFDGKNGFVFEERSPQALIETCRRAVRSFGSANWGQLVQAAMAFDSTWTRSAHEYVAMYEAAIRGRTEQSVKSA